MSDDNIYWRCHKSNLADSAYSFCKQGKYTDVEISLEDQRIHCHRVILASHSQYLAQLFDRNPSNDSPVILVGVHSIHFLPLLEFMYTGTLNVPTISQLSSVLSLAEFLQIGALENQIRNHNQAVNGGMNASVNGSVRPQTLGNEAHFTVPGPNPPNNNNEIVGHSSSSNIRPIDGLLQVAEAESTRRGRKSYMPKRLRSPIYVEAATNNQQNGNGNRKSPHSDGNSRTTPTTSIDSVPEVDSPSLVNEEANLYPVDYSNQINQARAEQEQAQQELEGKGKGKGKGKSNKRNRTYDDNEEPRSSPSPPTQQAAAAPQLDPRNLNIAQYLHLFSSQNAYPPTNSFIGDRLREFFQNQQSASMMPPPTNHDFPQPGPSNSPSGGFANGMAYGGGMAYGAGAMVGLAGAHANHAAAGDHAADKPKPAKQPRKYKRGSKGPPIADNICLDEFGNPKLSPSGKPMVKCEICGKELADPSSLYRHRKIHTGDKPHSCPFCTRRFIQRYNMRQHLKTHRKSGIPQEQINLLPLDLQAAYYGLKSIPKNGGANAIPVNLPVPDEIPEDVPDDEPLNVPDDDDTQTEDDSNQN